MSDSYQAVYDAVRSRISNGNVGEAVAEEARRAFDISYTIQAISQEWQIAAAEHARPFMTLRPKMSIDGDQWCALYGDNLQDGVAGFGDSPELAARDFDKQWHAALSAARGEEG